MQLHTPADIVGTGAAIKLSTVAGVNFCKWFQVSAVSVATLARVGDSNVSATRGIPILPTAGSFCPPTFDQLDPYDLTNTWVYLDLNDTASLCYA
jgi:hypothetical protein